jgi:hypothetical protein
MRFRLSLIAFTLLVIIALPLQAQFQTRSMTRIGSAPICIAVGDFNNDGKLDLAVANYLPINEIVILLGNGDGTFRVGASYSVGQQIFSGVAADFRHNGILDLAVADSLTNFVYVLLGNGDGTFQNAVTYETEGYPYRVAVGDVNGDGHIDVVGVTEITGTNVFTLLGNGDGTFQAAINMPVPYNIFGYGLATGQFNQDKNLDLAVVGAFGTANQADILLGNGDGTFNPDGFYPVLTTPLWAASGDFNNDRKQDLAVADYLGLSVSVLLGNGDGTFQPAVNYAANSPQSVLAEDLDGDGKVDLAAMSTGFSQRKAGVSFLKGNGDGTFQRARFFPAGNEQAAMVAAGDVNGDHMPDLIVADFIDEQVITLLNTGVVHFSPTTPIQFPVQKVGTTSAARHVTLTNTGTISLKISSMTANGPFAVRSTCGTSIAAGATCQLGVTFTPTVHGNARGAVSLIDSASSKPQVVMLEGIGQ